MTVCPDCPIKSDEYCAKCRSSAPSIDAVSGLVEELRALSAYPGDAYDRAADALEAQARELAEARVLLAKQYGVKIGRAVCLVSADGESVTDIYDIPAERMPNGYDYAEELAAEARITALESDAREKDEAWAFDFVAAWHERQARLFRDMADDDPRTAKPARDRAKEAAIHHAASAAALRNRASDDRRTALSKGEPQ